jgi:hypothetical protein
MSIKQRRHTWGNGATSAIHASSAVPTTIVINWYSPRKTLALYVRAGSLAVSASVPCMLDLLVVRLTILMLAIILVCLFRPPLPPAMPPQTGDRSDDQYRQANHLSVRNDPACVEPAKPGPAEVDGCPSVLIHRALVGVVVEAPLIIEASAENPEGGTKGPVVEAAGVKVFAGETDVDGMLEAGDTEEAPADDGRAVDEAAADAADEAGGTMRAEDATVEETGAAGAGPVVEGGGALDCGAPGLALRLKISVFFISTLCLH